MNFEDVLTSLDEVLKQKSLSNIQELVFRQTWQGKTYAEIAEEANYDPDYIKYVGCQLWQTLSEAFGEKVTKSNFKSVLRRNAQSKITSVSTSPELRTGPSSSSISTILEKQYFRDRGEAVDVSIFYGRDQELSTLHKWLVDENCRLVLLLGMGGIGKTALSVKLAEQVQDDFEYSVWRSLRNAPPLEEILTDLLKFLSNQKEIDLPKSIDGKISRLIHYLRKHRCLIILDNTESVLCETPVGYYHDGYENYGELFKRLGEEQHQSCLMLTSREKPKEFASLEGNALPVRSLVLRGLEETQGRKILRTRSLYGSEKDQNALVESYRGNPLALKIVSTSIRELFDSSITDFLREGSIVFNGIRSLLAQQLERLADVETKVMYWLAINRDPILLPEIQEDISPAFSMPKLLEALESLVRRSLIERGSSGFTQQPVVMEYMTEQLVEQVYQELVSEKVSILMNYALIKAQAKDYVRESQIRIILDPIIDRLRNTFKSQRDVEYKLKKMLLKIQQEHATTSGYAGGNIVNLLCQLKVNLTGYNFSDLAIWQAYLRDVNLHQVNFAHADLSKSVFAENLNSELSTKYSPDGEYLAAGDMEGVIRVWRVADGQQLLAYPRYPGCIWSIAFSPNGKMLASVSTDKTVRLWDIQTGECLKVLRGHQHWTLSVVFSPDGKTLASGSMDKTIRLWDVHTGQCLKVLQGHKGSVWSLAFKRTGVLASGSQDHTVKFWDLDSGENSGENSSQCIKTLQGHTDEILAIAFSQDGQLVASGGIDQTVRIWNVDTNQCLNVLEHPNCLLSLSFSADGRLASGCKDHLVRIWDIAQGSCVQVLKGHTHWVYSVDYAPKRARSQEQMLVSSGLDETIRFWDPETGQGLRTLQGHANWILSVALSPEGQIVSGGKDRTVRIWDPTTGQCLKVLKRHSSHGQIWSVACSPNGQTLVSGSSDGKITIWDIHTGQCLKVLQAHNSLVHSVTYGPDGRFLASGSQDNSVKLWDVATEQCLRTLEGHTHWVLSVTYALDGKTLVSASQDGSIKFWDVATGACLNTLNEHETPVWSVTFSPDGKMLASGSQDTTIKLWDVETRACLQTLKGHKGDVRSVTFSPDGKMLASGSQDTTVKLWDMATGECLKTLIGHTGPVWSVPIDAEEKLISGSQDETIRIWDLSTGKCLKLLRPDRPYEGMDITGVTGLTDSQKITLKSLGAMSF
jgi:WD40 repeat protein